MADKIGIPAPRREGESVTTSIRKIENGYITSMSRSSPDGGYSHTEEYSKERPMLNNTSDGARDDIAEPNSLQRAITKLGSFRKG